MIQYYYHYQKKEVNMRPTQDMKRLTISIDDKTLKVLAKIAEAYTASRSQVIRRLIHEESKRLSKLD